ncbi:MAG: DUF4867 family protein [Eubacteriales bacterium]|nr:DUF4867 family protein [Eubacteriales bacterium]
MLETLRKLNPQLPFYSVYDDAFKRFGRVIPFDATSLIETCEKAAVMPQSGSAYVPDMPELEALPAFQQVKDELRGEGSCQIGCCWGYNQMLNCLEYHRASEHNIAVSDIVLLLAAQQDMEGNDLPEGKIVGFYCPKGTTIEVYATSLHFCPCQTADEGFRCIVILPRGTNHALTKKPDEKVADGRLLWAVDKWLIAHPDNKPVVERGAYPGLHGENFKIRY